MNNNKICIIIQNIKVFTLITLLFFSCSFFSCQSTGGKSAGEQSTGGQISVENENKNEEEIEIDLVNDPFIHLAAEGEVLPVSVFPEIWAYVVAGREDALRSGLPLSDVAYFGAEIDTYGKLISVPDRKKLPPFRARVHMVVKCDGKALTHFILRPGSSERIALVADLLAAAKNYDGLQIDFENIPERDGENFLTFLKELRDGLGYKMFTVALYSRTRKINNDVYDYEKIKPIVDKIFVMAYDEHWSGSKSGPVASLGFCRRVAEYSLRVIGEEKLIMGLPFYGRAWGNHNPSRALIYSTTEKLIEERKITNIKRENSVPTFDYDVNVSVKLYYDDEYSLSTRMEMYKAMGVRAIGFWRLGQETPKVWNILKLAP